MQYLKNIKQLLLSTSDSYAPIALRVLLAIVIFPHGAQKLLGWFGGFGFDGTMNYFIETVGLTWFDGLLVIIIEFFGPLFLILGLGTRLWSLGLLVVMAGIIFTTINQYFFMNWFGAQKAEGYEFFLLAIAMSLSLLISGGGNWSLDKRLFTGSNTA